MKMIDSAIQYLKSGLNPIPIRTDETKKPFIEWKIYQNQKITEQEINEWWSKWPDANIGIVTGSAAGIMVVDLDNDSAVEEIEKYLPESLLIPTARTPRGGKHLWFKYQDGLKNKAEYFPGCDVRADGGYIIAPPSSRNGISYKWHEGLGIEEIGIPEIPSSLFIALSRAIKTSILDTPVVNGVVNESPDVVKFEKGRRDEDLFHVANCLIKGGMSNANAHKVLEIVARNCKPPFPENEIQIKIKSAIDRQNFREKSLADEVREFVVSSSGVFLSSEVHICRQMSSRDDKKNISKILSRLVDEKVIERYGNKNGQFRKIERDCDKIDFLAADMTPFKVHLPFGLDRLVKIHPKTLIVIAGEQNVGKTALLLNIALLNMYRPAPIRYFSSEMGDVELNERLTNFQITDNMDIREWSRIDFRERSEKFEDVVNPDGLNLIDYFEISDTFYNIAESFKKIFEKLNSGVAIIAVQKDQKADLGRGGSFSLEKPRLYLTLIDNAPAGAILKIRKAKSWMDKTKNPNGMQIGFKIVNGCKLMSIGDWYYSKTESKKEVK